MKTLVSLSIIFSLLLHLSSCRKTSGEESYYVKYKINGVVVTNTGANYVWLKPDPGNALQMKFQLTSTTIDFKNSLSITVQKNTSIPEGTYSTDDSSAIVIADYFEKQGAPDQKDYTTGDITSNPATPELSIVITAITGKSIRGTFNSNYLYNSKDSSIAEIADGEFYVRRNP